MATPSAENPSFEAWDAKIDAGVVEAIGLEVARRRAAGLPVYVSGSGGRVEDMAALRLGIPPVR